MHSISNSSSFIQRLKLVHAIPLYLLYIACIISALLLGAFWFMKFSVWIIGLLVLAAWTPIVMVKTADIYKEQKWIALLFVLFVSQTAHFLEHGVQFIQIHVFGLSGPMAAGIISVLNTEWVHFLWNAWVLGMGFILMFGMRHNIWLVTLFIFAIWHQIEHTYLIVNYIQTGLEGNPGLIARGGFIGGGLPLSRPDVHFIYAVFEEALLVLAYISEWRRFYKPSTVATPAQTT